MSGSADVKIELLRALYSSLGEFLAWTQLHESLGAFNDIPSPFLVIPWMRAFVHIIEDNLADSLDDGEVRDYRELHLALCCVANDTDLLELYLNVFY